MDEIIRAIDGDSDVAKELRQRIAELEAKLDKIREIVDKTHRAHCYAHLVAPAVRDILNEGGE